MKYQQINFFEKYLSELTLKNLLSSYFFIIKDEFLCQETVQLLLNKIPNESFTLTKLDAQQLNEVLLWEKLNTHSFLVDYQVIYIKNVDKLKKQTLEKLESYLKNPLKFISLILTASSYSKSSPLYHTIDLEGLIIDIPDIKPWEKEKYLIEWVRKQIVTEKKSISPQVCHYLIKRAGEDQNILLREIEKLICYCVEKREITIEDIRAICIEQFSQTIWQLGEAIFRRDTNSSLQMARSFLVENASLLPLIRQLRSQFQVGYQISLLVAQGHSEAEVTKEFPYMKGQILEKNLKQSQQYGIESYKIGILALDAMESRVKNSAIDEEVLLELLILELTQSKQ